MKKKHNNHKLYSIGTLTSMGLVWYVFLVSLLMMNGDKIFGSSPEIFGAITFLMLFVVSALVCFLLVFGGPVYLYLEKKKKDALVLLGTEVSFLVFILLMILLLHVI